MIRNVVKRLANPNRVNCLFDVIGQSDNYVKLFTEQHIYVENYQENEEEKTCFSLGRSAASFNFVFIVFSVSSVRPINTT